MHAQSNTQSATSQIVSLEILSARITTTRKPRAGQHSHIRARVSWAIHEELYYVVCSSLSFLSSTAVCGAAHAGPSYTIADRQAVGSGVDDQSHTGSFLLSGGPLTHSPSPANYGIVIPISLHAGRQRLSLSSTRE